MLTKTFIFGFICNNIRNKAIISIKKNGKVFDFYEIIQLKFLPSNKFTFLHVLCDFIKIP